MYDGCNMTYVTMHQPCTWIVDLECYDQISVHRQQSDITPRRIGGVQRDILGIKFLGSCRQDCEVVAVNVHWMCDRCLGLIDLPGRVVQRVLELAFDQEIHPVIGLVSIKIDWFIASWEWCVCPVLTGCDIQQA